MAALFRNLRIWTLDAPLQIDNDDALQRDAFAACGPAQAESLGWDDVMGDGEGLCRRIANTTVLRSRLQQRVLPAAAVAEAMAERLAEAEAREGGPIRGARRRELADQVRAELLPKAPLKSSRNWLVIDHEHGLVMIDSATASRGEALLSLLRGSLGNLPVRPLAFARPLDGTLTAWLKSGDLPPGFSLGQWADLEHPQDTANKVRFRGQPLDEDEVTATLDRGLLVTALELSWDAGAEEPLRFVLGEDGSFRCVRIPAADADAGDDESAASRLEADLALASLSLKRLFDALFPVLGGVPRLYSEGLY